MELPWGEVNLSASVAEILELPKNPPRRAQALVPVLRRAELRTAPAHVDT